MKIQLPQKNSIASFDVDPQCTFTPICPDELPVPEGDKIADELNQQGALASIRVVSRDAHSSKAVWIANDKKPQFSKVEGYKDVDIHWKSHAIVGTIGFDLIPGLLSSDYNYQVLKGIEPHKHPYGACYHDFGEQESTGAIEFLKQNGISTVLVGGLALDYCVKTTAIQLKRAGFEVIVNLAACRGISDETSEIARKEMLAEGVSLVSNSASLTQSHKNKQTF
jgi:nicotinamidase/pyrazinamidase